MCETVSNALARSIYTVSVIVSDPYSLSIYVCILAAAALWIGLSQNHICDEIMSMHVVIYAIGENAFKQTTNSWGDAIIAGIGAIQFTSS